MEWERQPESRRQPDAARQSEPGQPPEAPEPGQPPEATEAAEAASFAAWVGPSVLAMTRLAKRLAPFADADDVVQESLARAWQKRELFDPARGTPTTWLLAITADQARAARRSRVRRLRLIDESAELPDAPTTLATRDLDLDRAIGALPERQQLAVHLHYFVGLSVDETAEVMHCAAGTVKSTLFDARTALRAALGDPA